MIKALNEVQSDASRDAVRLTAYILATGVGLSMISVLGALSVANPVMLALASTAGLIVLVAFVDRIVSNYGPVRPANGAIGAEELGGGSQNPANLAAGQSSDTPTPGRVPSLRDA